MIKQEKQIRESLRQTKILLSGIFQYLSNCEIEIKIIEHRLGCKGCPDCKIK